jgi:hypothetical protein
MQLWLSKAAIVGLIASSYTNSAYTTAMTGALLLWSTRHVEKLYSQSKYLSLLALGAGLSIALRGDLCGTPIPILFFYHCDVPPPITDKVPVYLLALPILASSPTLFLVTWLISGLVHQ